MKMRKFVSICTLLCVLLSTSAFASTDTSEVKAANIQDATYSKICRIQVLPEEEVKYSDMQEKIIKSISDDFADLNNENDTKYHEPHTESKMVTVDFTNDLRAIKLSCIEPITIYEEVVTKTYYETSTRSVSYETSTITSSRTYNGATTTVQFMIGYYLEEDVTIGDVTCDAYCLQCSNVSFSSSGYGHISRIYAEHFQIGCRVDTGNYSWIIDGFSNSSDRTNQTFSMYTSSGSTNWSKLNTIYTGVLPLGATGCVGSSYTVTFV